MRASASRSSFLPLPTFLLIGHLLVLGLVPSVQGQSHLAQGVEGAAGQARVAAVEVPSPRGVVPETKKEAETPREIPLGMTKEAIEGKKRTNQCAEILRVGRVPPPELRCWELSSTKSVVVPPDMATGQLVPGANEVAPQTNAPVFGVSFQGDGGTSPFPPDPTMAAGRNNLVVATNQSVKIFSKDGASLSSQSLVSFFSPVTADNLFDPKVIYDQYIDRFWISAVSKNDTSQRSKLLIGFSKSGDATTGWNLFSLDATLNGSTLTTNWCDFPQIGIDAQAIYLTCNMFSFPSSTASFQNAKVRVLTKDQFVNNTCCLWVDFVLGLESGSPFTVQPAHMYGAVASDGEFLINADGVGGAGSVLEIWHITNAQSVPRLFRVSQNVGRFAVPPGARQPGATTRIDTGDASLLYAFWKNGLLSTGQNTACGSSSGTADACFAFTEINVSGFPSTVVTVNDWIFTIPGVDFFYPAVDVNSFGNKTMVYSRSSSTDFAGAVFIGIPDSSICTACTNGPQTFLRAGQNTYVQLDSKNRNRWGDYSGVAADPDGTGVWVHGEFSAAVANTWGTQVGITYELASNPINSVPAISSISPSSAIAGGPGFNLVVTGSNFAAGSVVRWNGSDRSTIFVTNTQLQATIPSSDLSTVGTAPITVFNPPPGGGFSNGLTFNILVSQVLPIPTANFQTIIPHSAFGGGFLTRLFISNLINNANALTINRIDQSGTVVQSTTAILQPGATLLMADSEQQRTQNLTIQWFAIGSQGPIAAAVLFDFDGSALSPPVNFRTAVGALASPPLTAFSTPLRVATVNVTVSIAIANLNNFPNTITLRLLDQGGNVVAQDSVTLGPFAQTAFALQDRSAFRNVILTPREFIGSLEVITTSFTQPVAAIVVGNNLNQLFSLPVTSGVAK